MGRERAFPSSAANQEVWGASWASPARPWTEPPRKTNLMHSKRLRALLVARYDNISEVQKCIIIRLPSCFFLNLSFSYFFLGAFHLLQSLYGVDAAGCYSRLCDVGVKACKALQFDFNRLNTLLWRSVTCTKLIWRKNSLFVRDCWAEKLLSVKQILLQKVTDICRLTAFST